MSDSGRHTREQLHAKWADLTERADRFRKTYRESRDRDEDQMVFIRAMRGLGFSYDQIRVEIKENRPGQ